MKCVRILRADSAWELAALPQTPQMNWGKVRKKWIKEKKTTEEKKGKCGKSNSPLRTKIPATVLRVNWAYTICNLQGRRDATVVARTFHRSQSWFHGNISRELAELRLQAAGYTDGLFLLVHCDLIIPRRHSYCLSTVLNGIWCR